MKYNPHLMAKAAAVTIGLVYLGCWLFLWLLPDFSWNVARTWFHGMDITKIAVPVSTDPASILIGLVSSVALTWLVVYVYGMTYNMMLKKWK